MEALDIIVPVFTAVLVSFITFFLTRSHYERKRQDDLVDRENNRLIEIRNDSLQEIQAYVDTYKKALSLLINIETGLIYTSNLEKAVEQFNELRELTNFTPKRLFSIGYFGDWKLKELNEKLVPIYDKAVNNAFALIKRVILREAINKEEALQELTSFNHELSTMIGQMQQRLNELTLKVS